ncbi:MAG: hypothetical protein ACOYMF_10785 [Bacteroidales bacterium]
MIFKNIIKFTSLAAIVLALAISSCRKEPVLADGTKKICFDTQVLNVMVNNCAMSGCHSSGGGELQDLSSYDGIKSYVKAGKPNKSKLYNVITAKGMVLTVMPPKPRPLLTVQEINDITIWILQGAEHTTCP